MDALRADNVCKTFAGGDSGPLAILNNVDLSVRQGEFLAIRGPSGSGKSTLLHILAGLEPPTDGAVYFRDRDLATLGRKDLLALRRDKFGFVFQFFNLLPGLDVIGNVAMPLMLAGGPRDAAAARASELIEAVGLSQRSGHLAGRLSGGEMQRVAVARALAPSPAVVFADEPTGNLDRGNGELVLDLLAELCRTAESSLVVVTHDDFVADRADRVAELVDGRLSAVPPVDRTSGIGEAAPVN